MHNFEALGKPTTKVSPKHDGEPYPVDENVSREHQETSPSVDEKASHRGSAAVEDCANEGIATKSNVRSDPLRFVVMVLFVALSISNAMQWIAFSSIVDEVREYFHMSAAEVNMLPTVYVISYISIVFLSCKLYEVTGIKIALVIAALFNAMGAWIKMLALYSWPNPTFLFISQAVNSITEVLIIATPPLIANRWFPMRERGVANTIMSSGLNIGSGVGVLVPTFFIGPNKSGKKHFANFFWFNFAICTVTLGLVVFMIPKKPRHAASYASQVLQRKEDARLKRRKETDAGKGATSAPATQLDLVLPASGREEGGAPPVANPPIEKKKEGEVEADSDVSIEEELNDEVNPVNVFSVLVDCYHMCRRNTSLLLLIIMSAAELGLVWSMETVLPQVFKPYNISEAMTGWISFVNLVLGTVVCPFLMPLVERFNCRYKLILTTTALVLTVDLILMTLLVHFGPKHNNSTAYYTTVMFICWGVIAGTCQNFTMPLMFEYVVELTFPMAESTSAPMLMWAACAMNLALTLIFGAVLTDDPDRGKSLIIFICSIVITFIGALAIMFTKPLHKRQDYEKRKCKEQDGLLDSAEHGDVNG